MTQNELIDKITEITGQRRAEIAHILKTAGDVVQSELAAACEVVLPGIGRLSVTQRAARSGRNPSTGATIAIPAKKVPHFAASKALKDAVA